jgi:hypothetical protein
LRDHRDIADYFEASLQFFYEAGSALRLGAGVESFRYVTMAGIIIASFFLWFVIPKVVLLPLVAGAIYWLWTTTFLQTRRYKSSLAQVHQSALNELVTMYEPEWRYTLRAPRMRNEVRHSGLFPQRYDFVHSHGCIAGTVNSCLMAAVKIEVGTHFFVTQKVGKLSRKMRKRRNSFEGFLVAIDMPKSFMGSLTIDREVPENPATLEAPTFEQIFRVSCTYEPLKEKILSAEMIQRLMDLDQQFALHPFTLSFKDSILYISIPWEQDIFSPAFDDHARWNAAYCDARVIEMISEISQSLLADPTAEEPKDLS